MPSKKASGRDYHTYLDKGKYQIELHTRPQTKGYDPKLAPTVTIETGKGLPHTIISNAQNLRRDERLSSGNGKWSSTLQDELKNLVSGFERAGFSKENISETLPSH
ncbi:hypothetical protein TU65_25490 [Bacillus wiedmannii]|nr:hypothetical protein TU65_25490 [Bacillus wiedmannii]SCN08549.1 Uncharacterized protein BCRIVMBC126_02608 [Bacillus wiedmannii]